jgi:hypothetical protein
LQLVPEAGGLRALMRFFFVLFEKSRGL